MELVSAPGTDARLELQSITSIAAMLIAEEYARLAPITLSGGGPLLRVYTLHGEEALGLDLDEEGSLAFDPTVGNSWRLSLPALGDDLDVARAAVAGASHVEVRDAAAVEMSSAEASSAPLCKLVLDPSELERP